MKLNQKTMSNIAEEITVRKFLLKKYPTNKYFDCPVPKNYWEDMEEYAKLKTSELEKEIQELKRELARYEIHDLKRK